MKKTLYMHFRMHKRNRNKLDDTILDLPIKGAVTTVEVAARGGVTVVGILSDDEKTIIWGAVKCYGVNYDKRLGREGAYNIAIKGDGVVTVNLDYDRAKDYAEALGHLVYENGVRVGLRKFQDIVTEDKNLG